MEEVFENDSQDRTSSRTNYARLKLFFQKLTWHGKVFHILLPQNGTN